MGKGKITLDEYDSFSNLKNQVIHDQLQGVYVSEILRVLYKFKKDFFRISENDMYEDILEFISRRNCHIHNKGKVDQKYFEKGNGADKYNVKKGSYLPIDCGYFKYVSTTLQLFIQNLF